jgi:hypothetical protein
MVYSIDEYQLLRLWSIMRCFAEIRENTDRETQYEILTNAQIHLTAFLLDLKPSIGDQTSSTPPRTSPDRIATFDA